MASIKRWRVEIVTMVRSKEKIETKEFRCPSESGARQMGLMTRGAVRISAVVEIGEDDAIRSHRGL